MTTPKRSIRPRRSPFAKRKSQNSYVTKSGQTIKLHRSIVERFQAHRDARALRRAKRLAGMPKGRIRRFFYRLHPKRLYRYWFSREGLVMGLKLTGIGIIVGFLGLVGLFAYFRKDLPNLRDISGNNIGGSIRYYDKTGKVLLWEDYDAVKRTPVTDEDIAQVMKDATIAVEDKEFFNHGGFDLRGITRAAWANFTGGETTQGGSTITQQLVKLTQEWTNERTYTRKIKELILSVELERSYSKQEILVGYLNTAPYGDITYGVEAASQDYFNKSAKNLSLDEAAFLAAMPKSPTIYSPYGARYDKESLLSRQDYILDLMAEQGKITTEQRDEAKDKDTLKRLKPRQPKYAGIKAPWFVLTAKDQLNEDYGEDVVNRGGWKVRTTLDMDVQRQAEKSVRDGMAQVRFQGGDTAAFVAEDVKTGQVVALVGGSDFSNKTFGQNNYARSKLPPGSSFKPYDYVTLIENSENFGAGSVLYDKVGPLPGYPCTRPGRGGNCLNNFDFRQPGPLTLRYALGGSRNIPAVKAMLIAGIDKTIETAEDLMGDPGDKEEIRRLGYNCYQPGDTSLTKEAPCYGSSAIGDGAFLKLDEHVHGYATLSRNGRNLPQTYILEIVDAAGKTVDEWKPEAGQQVVREEAAYIVSDILSDPRASYFSRKIHDYQGWDFSIKTGTTNDSKDGWLMGFSTKYAAGVWVGYHNRQVEMRGFMENMTRPIWESFMTSVHNGKKPEARHKPGSLKTLPAFIVRNHVGVGSIEPSPTSDLFPSWYKKTTAANKKQTIDIVSNKLATTCTPGRARKETTGGSAGAFSGDPYVAGGAANTSEKDDIHKCSDDKPQISLSVSPSGSSYIIGATVTRGTHPLNSSKFPGTVNFTVDGKVIKSVRVTSSGPIASFNYTPDFSGNKTLKAEVIDSVLYDDSDTATLTGAADSFVISKAEKDGGQVYFEWSGGTGNVIIKREGSGFPVCSSSSGSCNAIQSLAPVGSKVYAEDEDGNTSPLVEVSD